MTHEPRPGSFAIDGGVNAVYRARRRAPRPLPRVRPARHRAPARTAAATSARTSTTARSRRRTTRAAADEDRRRQPDQHRRVRRSSASRAPTTVTDPPDELDVRVPRAEPGRRREPPEPVDPTEPPDPLDPEFWWYGCASGWPGDSLQLEDGPNQLEVRAIDRAGNVDATPDVAQLHGRRGHHPAADLPHRRAADRRPRRNSAVFGFIGRPTTRTDPSLIEYECRHRLRRLGGGRVPQPDELLQPLDRPAHASRSARSTRATTSTRRPATSTGRSSRRRTATRRTSRSARAPTRRVDEAQPITNFGTRGVAQRQHRPGRRQAPRAARPLRAAGQLLAGCQLAPRRLRLHSDAEPGRTLEARRSRRRWAEMQRHLDQPARRRPAHPPRPESGNGYREWDVTSQVEPMLATPAASHGF